MRAKSPKRFYMDLPIRWKIQLSMLLIAAVAISVGSGMYYGALYRDYIKNANASAADTVLTVSSTLHDNFSTLFLNIFRFLDTDEMNALFAATESGQEVTVNALADTAHGLDGLVRSNNLIDTILLIKANGANFSSKRIRLKDENARVDLWPDHGPDRVTWLSARKTPYVVPDKYVLPLTFSLSQHKGLEAVVPRLVDNSANLSLRLAVFFDYAKMKNLLQVNDADRVGTTYIADASLRPLSLSDQAFFYPVANDPAFIDACAAVTAAGETQYGKQTYIVHKANVLVSGLQVVHITHKAELLSGLAALKQVVAMSVLVTVLTALLLSANLANITTRPINKLVAYVSGMQPGGRRSAPFITQYHDEIGTLGTAINSMLGTISKQMDTIKEEERRRATAEIMVLTQQINPHFIYNTLDCIRWEVLAGNSEGSARMIEALAKFLRLGFGHTGETVTVAEEFERVAQYVQIMQYRLHGHIQFTSYIEAGLDDWHIPKMILQPMVENSIKHGFHNLVGASGGLPPEIHLYAQIEDGEVCLGVEDNGTGIDIEKARASLSLPAGENHCDRVGLHNSYQRLRRFFGEDRVTVQFASTPYFVNRVAYRIRREPG